MVSGQFLRWPQEDALRLRRQKDAEDDAMLREERRRRRQQEAVNDKIVGWISGTPTATNPNNLSVTWWKNPENYDKPAPKKTLIGRPTTSQGRRTLSNHVGSGNPFIVGLCNIIGHILRTSPPTKMANFNIIGKMTFFNKWETDEECHCQNLQNRRLAVSGWSDDGLDIYSKHLRSIKQPCKSFIWMKQCDKHTLVALNYESS